MGELLEIAVDAVKELLIVVAFVGVLVGFGMLCNESEQARAAANVVVTK